MSRVLVIGKNKEDARRLSKIYLSVNVPCQVVEGFDAGLEAIQKDPPALVVAEKPAGLDALQGLSESLKVNSPATPFLVTIPSPSMEGALDVMRLGAYDCLSKPLTPFDVLIASKRATAKSGRMLFVARLRRPKKHPFRLVFMVAVLFSLVLFSLRLREGPPSATLSLGSANLSGIHWDGRTLWVGDWFDSTVTHTEVQKGWLKSTRALETKVIYKMQEGQPIALCNTPDSLVTIGADLKLRAHQRSVGLPAYQTALAPAQRPTGLAWDGAYVWSSDAGTSLLYRHGSDLNVLETVKSVIAEPLGLTCDGTSLWVIGGSPLRVAQMEIKNRAYVWRGPFIVTNLLTEGVTPSGLSIGFGRLWAVSGGDPRMVSIPLHRLTGGREKK